MFQEQGMENLFQVAQVGSTIKVEKTRIMTLLISYYVSLGDLLMLALD